MENAHAKTSEELFQFFGTGPDGLSEIKWKSWGINMDIMVYF